MWFKDSRKNEERLVWYPRNADGYENQTVESNIISYFNIHDLLAQFFITTHYNYGAIANWRNYCIGITSRIFDAKEGHMPMFDYDGKNVKKKIRKDVKMLQQAYGLGDAWVYETKRGFHVYFFCDRIGQEAYMEALKKTECCRGFLKVSLKKKYATLRVSAKYTKFDVRLLHILPTKNKMLKREHTKGHVIKSLLALGEECSTHFAAMYPEWAYFIEDSKEWKNTPTKKFKRIIKVKAKPKSILDDDNILKFDKIYKGNMLDYVTTSNTSNTTTDTVGYNITLDSVHKTYNKTYK